MKTKPRKFWSRINMLSYAFARTAERAYVDYLNLSDELKKTSDDHSDPIRCQLEQRKFEAGITSIVFAAMYLEASAYDLAAIHLGDDFVVDHLDKVDMISKWVVTLRLVFQKDIDKVRATYSSLKQLVKQETTWSITNPKTSTTIVLRSNSKSFTRKIVNLTPTFTTPSAP